MSTPAVLATAGVLAGCALLLVVVLRVEGRRARRRQAAAIAAAVRAQVVAACERLDHTCCVAAWASSGTDHEPNCREHHV